MQITTASKIGLRDYQEDRYVVHHTNSGVLLGVMDGHGGEDVADVCKDYLAPFWDLAASDGRPFDKALALTIWQLNCITGEYHSGSTISLAFVPEDLSVVHVATLGDSPVIVHSPGGGFHVSTSHNARTNPEELEAARERGAVYDGNYIYDDFHSTGLQMTRSLGDCELSLILSRDPSIDTHRLGEFVLLATDGVFDPAHLNELAAIGDVTALIAHGATAEDIVNRAVKLKTGDNATAILLKKEPQPHV